jgi:hypothetical protein
MRAKSVHSTVASPVLPPSQFNAVLEALKNPASSSKDLLRLIRDYEKPVLSRKRKFTLGLWLSIWPVVIAALVPAQGLADLDLNLLANSRLPITVFCFVALISEAAAAWLFLPMCKRFVDLPEDRLTTWATIGAAAAGACTLAFLAATVANILHFW